MMEPGAVSRVRERTMADLAATAQHRRTELRRLDACLTVLEDALENDQDVLDEACAAHLRPVLPWMRPGMSIRAAIQLVWRRQAEVLGVRTTRASAAEPIPEQRVHTVILW
jgi:hypothetical protein